VHSVQCTRIDGWIDEKRPPSSERTWPRIASNISSYSTKHPNTRKKAGKKITAGSKTRNLMAVRDLIPVREDAKRDQRDYQREKGKGSGSAPSYSYDDNYKREMGDGPRLGSGGIFA
jgi:hypothetical protein